MTTEEEGPKRITDRVLELNLTGHLMPVDENQQPVLLHMVGAGADLFLPVFSTFEKLVAGMELARTPYHKIKQIVDGLEFLESLEENETKLRVIVDFYKHENGRIRFQEVFARTS